MKRIPLTQNQFALIDDEDYQRVLTHTSWHARWSSGTGTFYVFSSKGSKTTPLGRFLMNAPANMFVDHINKDTLDNRKCNLRICTNSQNQMNRGKAKNNKSGFKGVHWSKESNKWRAQIRLAGKCKHLGLFIDILDAVQAYNEASIKYHGEFGYQNVINKKDI